MKAQKKLNVVLIVLVIILISIISFVGIFRLEKNEMKSILPDYILGTDISGYRKIALEVVSQENETDSETLSLGEVSVSGEENVTENDQNAVVDENSVDENTTNQSEEEISNEKAEQYLKAAKIIKERLKSLKVEDYKISLNIETGKIELALPENDQTDIILSDIGAVGNFTISDTNTGEVLITNKDVRNVEIKEETVYGYKTVVMNIKFTAGGSRIFKNITANYGENATIEKEVENTVDETQTESTETNESVDNTTEETASNTETVAKTVALKIDDVELLTTGFPEIVENGVLTLTLTTSTDEEEILNSKYSGMNVATIMENDPLPFEYEVTENVYLESTVDITEIKTVICILIFIVLLITIAMIIKFKMKGLLSSILSIGFVALLLIVIRYTNVTMSLEGILAVGLAFFVNTVFNYILLTQLKGNLSKEEKVEKYMYSMKKYSLITLPLLILSIVCCFTNWDTIYSFGMVTFWTIIISLLYNLIVTNLLVRNK